MVSSKPTVGASVANLTTLPTVRTQVYLSTDTKLVGVRTAADCCGLCLNKTGPNPKTENRKPKP